MVQKISTSLLAGSAFALSVACVPTVAPAGSVHRPLATGAALIVGRPCVAAAAGMTVGPSVTVKAMCGKGRDTWTGCTLTSPTTDPGR